MTDKKLNGVYYQPDQLWTGPKAINVYILIRYYSTGASDRCFLPIFNKRSDHLQILFTIHGLKNVLSTGSLRGLLVHSP